jgi:hypothetical protein
MISKPVKVASPIPRWKIHKRSANSGSSTESGAVSKYALDLIRDKLVLTATAEQRSKDERESERERESTLKQWSGVEWSGVEWSGV